MKTRDVVGLLGRPPLFADAPPAVLEAVAREAVIRTFRKGAIVVSEGERAEACYVMAEGSAKVFRDVTRGI